MQHSSCMMIRLQDEPHVLLFFRGHAYNLQLELTS